MSYVDSNLLTGEKVVVRGKVHWGIYVRPFLVIGIGIACAVGASNVKGPDGSPNVVLMIGAGLGIFFGLISLLSRAVRAGSVEYAVTDKRVIIKVGILSRSTMETQLAKVESVNVEQGIMGRILGYGAIKLTGTGGSHEGFPYLAAPLAFKRAVQEQAEAASQKTAKASA